MGVLSAGCDGFSYNRERLSFPQRSESIFCLHVFVLSKDHLSSTRLPQAVAACSLRCASLSPNPAQVPWLIPGIRLGLEGRAGLEPWKTIISLFSHLPSYTEHPIWVPAVRTYILFTESILPFPLYHVFLLQFLLQNAHHLYFETFLETISP